jgi:hypothetical protein
MSIEIEKRLLMSDGRIITDQAEIDKIMDQRDSLIREKHSKSPDQVISDIDLTQATLAKEEANVIGVHQASTPGNNKPFSVDLYDIISDALIDLTPESEGLPRKSAFFRLAYQDRQVVFEVLFSDGLDELIKDQLNEKQSNLSFDTVLGKVLLHQLQERNWQLGHYNAWSVAE